VDIYAPQGYGYLGDTLSNEELAPIKKEIDNIFLNKVNAKPMNDKLVGHIRKEYALTESHDWIEQVVIKRAIKYEEYFGYLDNNNTLTDSLPLKLSGAWVNFQNKHEFNPLHNHSGIFSFVIWIKIPYTQDSELKFSPGVNSTDNMSGKFQLVYNNPLGGITLDSCGDLMQEGNIILFPACMHHCVYPFYSSDEYRISVAGNFALDSKSSK